APVWQKHYAMRNTSDRGLAALVGADAHDILDRQDEDFAVADLAGLGGPHDRVNGLAGSVVGDGDLEFHLREKIHRVFAAAVNLRVALLAAEALDLGDGHAADADGGQGFLHFLEFEWLNDG